MPSDEATLSRSQIIARRFGARAKDYDNHAILQHRCASGLAAFVDARNALPPAGAVVEIGCGTGLLTTLLSPHAESWLATDISAEMLAHCRARMSVHANIGYAALDGECVQFSSPPAAIVTNLVAQWFSDPAAGLVRLASAAPRLAFSVPVAGSFPEWEMAFKDLGRNSGLLSLPDCDAVKSALRALPGRTTHFEVHSLVIHYPDARSFADSFRMIGADQPRPGYRPKPIREVLQRFANGMKASARILYGLVLEEQ